VWIEVFAVEDTSIQVCWDHAPRGDVTVTASARAPVSGATSDRRVIVAGNNGPGGAVVDGLPPGSRIQVSVQAGVGPVMPGPTVHTLVPPPGRLLSRFATVNDIHIGARWFGTVKPFRDDDLADPPPVRCARAALDELQEWGAQALIVKGDTTQQGRPEEWDIVGSLLGAVRVPVLMIEGNHETKWGAIDGTAKMAEHGIRLNTTMPGVLDLPGVRVVGVPTAHWHSDNGAIKERVLWEAASLTAAAGGPAVVALHHYPQRFRYPTLYPWGIPGPAARHALDVLADANPATLVIAGHTHRHRRHTYHRLLLAETGSTKDFPGSWTGYSVYEGGIMQTTRRIMAPRAMAWTEQGRRVMGGLWGVWSPGVRTHRCFTHPWPVAVATVAS
jgi:predicted phosphodiesterase